MTWFLRQAFLFLVACATLALIVMMAITAEAKDPALGTSHALVIDELARLPLLAR